MSLYLNRYIWELHRKQHKNNRTWSWKCYKPLPKLDQDQDKNKHFFRLFYDKAHRQLWSNKIYENCEVKVSKITVSISQRFRWVHSTLGKKVLYKRTRKERSQFCKKKLFCTMSEPKNKDKQLRLLPMPLWCFKIIGLSFP